MIVLFFGAPGVGKGTQAAMFAERRSFGHLSTGDAFRNAIANQTETGKIAKQYVESGSLVPDEVVTNIVKEALQAPEMEGNVILDGFPRTVAQALSLDQMVNTLGRNIDAVVSIDVAEDIIVARLLGRGRKDDTEDIIRHRLGVYMQETLPILEHYKKNGVVIHEVDGNATTEEVYEKISTLLS